ncbi:VOC family protein [Deinococcus sp.]|uniref:VOC family protein n=1 Tax=Deinococcus sp. TaxID=47478 RepID=UPI002869C7D4|nr:VOC family protein [Deinococcus sp.]
MSDRPTAWPQGLTAITVFTEDLAATSAFYQEVFGLPVAHEDSSSAVFLFGPTMLNLLDIAHAPELVEPVTVAPHNAGARTVFTLTVDDVDALCADLQRRGVTLLNGPMDRPWGIRTASFRDPSGQIWEIAQ